MTRFLRSFSEVLAVATLLLASVGLVHAQCAPETITPPPASICPSATDPPLACVNPPLPSCDIGPLAFTNSTTLGWGAPAVCGLSPLLYDIAKGDLDVLHDTCELVSNTCDSCTIGGEDSAANSLVDAGIPPVGHGWWYVVRADDGPGGGIGSYNSSALTQCSDYDPGSPASCLP